MKPLGRLANKELRQAKVNAHNYFDLLWKNGEMNRKDAYKWLAEQLKISFDKCHIGMFDVDMCKKVVECIRERKYSVKTNTNIR
jgi:ABC-type transport system involved in Fe-S cluster assembly fused permease/ATPase subunit